MAATKWMIWIFTAIGMGWAMAEATGDAAVGIAIGVGIASAISLTGRRGAVCGVKAKQKENQANGV